MEIFADYIKSTKEYPYLNIVEELPKTNTSFFKILVKSSQIDDLIKELRHVLPDYKNSKYIIKKEEGYIVLERELKEGIQDTLEKHYFNFHCLTKNPTKECIITYVKKYRNDKKVRNYDYISSKLLFHYNQHPLDVLGNFGFLDYINKAYPYLFTFENNEFVLIQDEITYVIGFSGWEKVFPE